MKRLLQIVLALCVFQTSAYPYKPNPALTPGKAASTDTAQVCASHYPEQARKVSGETKNGIYFRYGIDPKACRQGCKIDHLIPLAIGGSNQVQNLWPHEYGAEWNVYQKTKLETRLRKEVCHNNMPITEAQQCIATDWTACYQRFYKDHK